MSTDAGFWNSPVPYFESKSEAILAIAGFVFFVVLFLLFFQPFGVNNYDPQETIDSELLEGVSVFAIVMFVTLTFNEFVIRPAVFPQLTGSVSVTWLAWSLIFLSTVLFVTYNLLGGWHDWKFSSYLQFIVNVSVMGIIPAAAIIFFLYQRGLRRRLLNLTIEHHESEPDNIVLTADNGDRIELPLDAILYLQSQDNYVVIYADEERGVTRHILRGTITRVASEVEGTSLIQCHRAFIVNTGRVTGFEGNLHKMELKLDKGTERIPVSRNYTRKVQDILR